MTLSLLKNMDRLETLKTKINFTIFVFRLWKWFFQSELNGRFLKTFGMTGASPLKTRRFLSTLSFSLFLFIISFFFYLSISVYYFSLSLSLVSFRSFCISLSIFLLSLHSLTYPPNFNFTQFRFQRSMIGCKT